MHFADARLLVDRANEHIDELDAGLQRFFANKQWTTVVEPNVEKAEYVYKVRFLSRLNPRLKAVAADAATNLRSSLDHIAAESSRLAGALRPDRARFPFGNSAAKLEESINGWCREIPTDVVSYFRSLQPYQGGNDLLYSLTQISGSGKHWALVPVVINISAVVVTRRDCPGERIAMTVARPASSVDEIVLFTTKEHATDYHLTIASGPRFEGIAGPMGPAPIGSFREASRTVAEIVDETEAILLRLGLLT